MKYMTYEVGQFIRVYHVEKPDYDAIATITKINTMAGFITLVLDGSNWAQSYEICTDPKFWQIEILDIDEMQFRLMIS